MHDDIYLQPPKYSSSFNIHFSSQFYVKASHRKNVAVYFTTRGYDFAFVVMQTVSNYLRLCYHMVLKSLEGSWCVLRDVWSPWNLTRMTGTILVRFPLKFEEIVIPTLHRDCATIRLDRSPLVSQRSPKSCLGSLKLLRPCRGHHSCPGRWGGWLLTGCSNGAGGRHAYHRGRNGRPMVAP